MQEHLFTFCSFKRDLNHVTGGRGFYVYIVNGTTDASSIDRNSATVEHADQSRWEANGWGHHAIQVGWYLVQLMFILIFFHILLTEINGFLWLLKSVHIYYLNSVSTIDSVVQIGALIKLSFCFNIM